MTALERFYKTCTVEPTGAAYRVSLDGRAVRTPAKAALSLPSRRLAEAVAAEWNVQDAEVQPRNMPMMQLVSTAIDRVTPNRDEAIDGIAAYSKSDLLCYRAASPRALAERQRMAWQPVLDWAALTYDATLTVTVGVMPVIQPDEAVAALRNAVADSDDFTLAAMHTLTAACGSLLLALAVRDRELEPAGAFDASQVDETWQAEQWGRDAEAEARRERMRAEIVAAGRFLALLRGVESEC